jgi:hypothetical protein
MLKLVEIKALDGYRLWLRYADGAHGEIDVSDLVGRGVFEAWNDSKFFRSVRIDESGAPVWGNDLDLCPDALYLRLTGKTPEELFPNVKSPEAHA